MKTVVSILMSLILSLSALFGIPVSEKVQEKAESLYSDNEIVTVIVETTGTNLLSDVNSAAERKSFLKDFFKGEKYQAIVSEQEKLKESIAKKFSVADFANSYSYSFALNGFSLRVPFKYIEKIEKLPGVKSVSVAGTYEQPENIAQENAAEPNMADAAVFTGVPETQQSGYTGKGTVVAVLDTGFDLSHEAFDFEVEAPRLSKTDINVITTFKCLNTIVPRWGANYYSNKIPYKWDYANVDKTVDNKFNFHGTHVAGIVGGKGKTPMYAGGPTLTGVAPDAQLLLMKVFGDKEGSLAEEQNILAALDDAVKLGADVVNMSLGSPSGQSEENIFAKDVYRRLQKAGVDVICSAGNEASFGKNDATPGSTTVDADLFDYGTLGSPSSYQAPMSVASSAINSRTSSYYSDLISVSGKGSIDISDFSSWGTTADLKLKPEITAPGSHIYSSVPETLNDKNDPSKGSHLYEAWYGTSMASPYFAGSVALLKQYLNETNSSVLDKNGTENMNSILMSTATVFKGYGKSAVYSPRRQGAGLVNLNAATSTKAYLTSATGSRPKIELGENTSGKFQLKFNVVNMSDEALTYSLSVIPLTDSFTKQNGKYVNTLTSKEISKKDYIIEYLSGADENGTVTVAPKGKTEIFIELTVSENLIESQSEAFKNGFFLDGFIFLKSNSEPTLSLPYMAFCGDWGKEMLWDNTMYDDAPSYMGRQWGLAVTDGNEYYPLGANIFESDYGKQYGIDSKYCAYSKNALKSKLNKPYVVTSLGLIRNAKTISYSLYSDKGIFRYCGSTMFDYCRKTYNPDKPQIGKLWGVSGLINGNGYVYKVTTKAANYDSGKVTISFPFVVDNDAAKIENIEYTVIDGKKVLSLTATDNRYIMGYEVLTSDGKSLGKVSLKDKEENGKYVSTFEITPTMEKKFTNEQLSSLQVYMLDYAYNETTASVSFNGVEAVQPEIVNALADAQPYTFVPAEEVIEINQ